MKLGQLDQRVLVQRRIELRSPSGEATVSYVDAMQVWAAVEPLSGRELFQAQQSQSEVTTRIRVHWTRDITELMRIVHTRSYDAPPLRDVYDIQSVLDIRSRHLELELLCIRRPTEQPLAALVVITADASVTADADTFTADSGADVSADMSLETADADTFTADNG